MKVTIEFVVEEEKKEIQGLKVKVGRIVEVNPGHQGLLEAGNGMTPEVCQGHNQEDRCRLTE